MADERTNRDKETRAKELRPPVTFIPAALLPELENKDPDYVYRWIRISSKGQSDTSNVSNKMRAGWVPVSAEEAPSIMPIKDPHSRFPGMIEHGGHLLCKISKERHVARQKYYDELARRQIEGVDNNFMRENDRRMPLFRERSSKVMPFG